MVLMYTPLPVTDLKTVMLDVTVVRTHGPNKRIGTIRWARDWRQYTFAPAADTEYTRGLLIEIRKKLARLMYEWKKTQPTEPQRGAPRRT